MPSCLYCTTCIRITEYLNNQRIKKIQAETALSDAKLRFFCLRIFH